MSFQNYKRDFVLMHKDCPVVGFSFNEMFNTFERINVTYNTEHLPTGTIVDGDLDLKRLNLWWDNRQIPRGRVGFERFKCSNMGVLFVHKNIESYGLSLSDQYWIKPNESDVTWSMINYFENGFSLELGERLFGEKWDDEEFDVKTPDVTTDGIAQKKWTLTDGEPYLIKSGTPNYYAEAYNEIIATILCEVLDIPHVKYDKVRHKWRISSSCRCFIDPSMDFVSATMVFGYVASDIEGDFYAEYVKKCKNLGVDIVPFLDRMIVLDYIMENFDRHCGNFGLIRDADTLEYLGPAPIFDTGSSLRCLSLWKFHDREYRCKPFRKDFDEQLSLVTDLDWIDFDRLYGALDRIKALLTEARFDEKGYSSNILGLLEKNISKVESLSNERSHETISKQTDG